MYEQAGASLEKLREEAISTAIERAREKVQLSYEQSSNPEDRLSFHNSTHTNDVIRRIELIVNTIKTAEPALVTPQVADRAKIAGAFHDTVQNWTPKEDKGRVMRNRAVGKNEKASGNLAAEYLAEANRKSRQEIFTSEDARVIREAIDATVPGWNPALGTVVQPNVEAESTLVARVLALADINGAGIDGGAAYLRDSDILFREENLDIARAFGQSDAISPEAQAAFRERMLAWERGQVVFAEGRKSAFGQEIKVFSEPIQEQLRILFNKFDESIHMQKERLAKRTEMSFGELAEDMGYQS